MSPSGIAMTHTATRGFQALESDAHPDRAGIPVFSAISLSVSEPVTAAAIMLLDIWRRP